MTSQIEAEAAVEKFLDHLRAWLVQQPEWPMILLPGRQTRKEVAQLIAKEIMTIPSTLGEPGMGNRALRRSIMRAMERDDKRFFEGIDL